MLWRQKQKLLKPVSFAKDIGRAGLRLRPIRPLPRALLLEKAPNLGANFLFFIFFIYKYFWEILKHFSLYIFFSQLRRLKKLSNVPSGSLTLYSLFWLILAFHLLIMQATTRVIVPLDALQSLL